MQKKFINIFNRINILQNSSNSNSPKKESVRCSNIELFRIVLMLIIIAHHYVVNSGIPAQYNFSYELPSFKMFFFQSLGFGGKMAINCFLLISGYFMIKSEFKIRKLIHLYIQIKFYKLVIYIIFALVGYEDFNLKIILSRLFSVLYSIGYGRSFPELFLFLYLLSPYINKLLFSIEQNAFKRLVLILLFYFTGLSTIFRSIDTINYVGWFITVYMIGAYIRLYPNQLTESRRFGKCGSIIIWGLSISSIFIGDVLRCQQIWHIKNYYYWVNDAHKPLAVLLAIFLCIWFKNMELSHNKLINKLASSVFGILLIHANSDAMREFLWYDLLKNDEFYHSPYFMIHAIGSIIIVYLTCFIIDQARRYLFAWLKK